MAVRTFCEVLAAVMQSTLTTIANAINHSQSQLINHTLNPKP